MSVPSACLTGHYSTRFHTVSVATTHAKPLIIGGGGGNRTAFHDALAAAIDRLPGGRALNVPYRELP